MNMVLVSDEEIMDVDGGNGQAQIKLKAGVGPVVVEVSAQIELIGRTWKPVTATQKNAYREGLQWLTR